MWRHIEVWLRLLAASLNERGSPRGQGLVEYAMILVLVVIVVFIVVVLLGPWVGNIYSNVVNAL